MKTFNATLSYSEDTSVFTLAYLGDAWYELWCRQKILALVQKSDKVHQLVTQIVCCQAQAMVAETLLPHLNFQEQQIYKRGRNNKSLTPPKHASMKDYRAATGFECLVGFWYLNEQQERFFHLMEIHVVQQLFKQFLTPL